MNFFKSIILLFLLVFLPVSCVSAAQVAAHVVRVALAQAVRSYGPAIGSFLEKKGAEMFSNSLQAKYGSSRFFNSDPFLASASSPLNATQSMALVQNSSMAQATFKEAQTESAPLNQHIKAAMHSLGFGENEHLSPGMEHFISQALAEKGIFLAAYDSPLQKTMTNVATRCPDQSAVVPVALTRDPRWIAHKQTLERLWGTSDYVPYLQAVTDQLNARMVRVQAIARAEGIKNLYSLPPAVINLHYELLDKAGWAEHIEQRCIQDPVINSYRHIFYHTNSLLKGLSCKDKEMAYYEMPACINDAQHSQARLLFNKLAQLDNTHPLISHQINKAIELVHHACEMKDLHDYDFYIRQATKVLESLSRGVNEHTIPLTFMDDVLWPGMEAELNSLLTSPTYESTLDAMKTSLSVRFLQMKELVERCGTTVEAAPKQLKDICYDFLMTKPETWVEMVEARFKREPLFVQMSRYLYWSNGVLKVSDYDPEIIQAIKMPASILNDASGNQRILLNHCVAAAETPALHVQAMKGIDALYHACSAPTVELHNALTDHAANILHACLDEHADKHIFGYDIIRPEMLSQQATAVYNQALELMAREGIKLRNMEGRHYDLTLFTRRLHSILLIKNAENAIAALSRGEVADAQQYLLKSNSISFSALKIAAQELTVNGKEVSYRALLEKVKTPAGARATVAVLNYRFFLATKGWRLVDEVLKDR